ncbi:uncharacterized protein [Leptinotarsa decemlineata]|uniref:uncharacterized protein n=1 Tax=Leptinotarsa decemlineata TaxID=7539 RepID=UPI003D305E08
MDNSDVQLVGGPCGQHGPYTFYKAFKYSKNGVKRIVTLSEFFFVKMWRDSDLLCIGELQLLWCDKNSEQVLASLRLYFLPENTPEGRSDHGEDEVLAISEKVVIRVDDLVTWITTEAEWTWGRLAMCETDMKSGPESDETECVLPKKATGVSFSLCESGLDFSDVEIERRALDGCQEKTGPHVVILSFPKYCRYRAMMKRLEGVEDVYLKYKIVNALGGFYVIHPNTRVLFCKDTFDYPELEGHELLCNHLSPKLKGRPRGKRKKRSVSPASDSNESESSLTANNYNTRGDNKNGLRHESVAGPRRSTRCHENNENKEFVRKLSAFMKSIRSPIGRIPSLGYKELNLHEFFTKVQKLGGYDCVTTNKLWKNIFDDMSGHQNSTSAATVIRRHYERFLLSYERHVRGEEYKPLPASERRRLKIKRRSNSTSDPETNSCETSPTPSTSKKPVDVITPPENKEVKTEGKTSSLRSVRVKPERQKEKQVQSEKDTMQNNNNIKYGSENWQPPIKEEPGTVDTEPSKPKIEKIIIKTESMTVKTELSTVITQTNPVKIEYATVTSKCSSVESENAVTEASEETLINENVPVKISVKIETNVVKTQNSPGGGQESSFVKIENLACSSVKIEPVQRSPVTVETESTKAGDVKEEPKEEPVVDDVEPSTAPPTNPKVPVSEAMSPVEGKENIPLVKACDSPVTSKLEIIEVPFKPKLTEAVEDADPFKQNFIHEVKRRKLDILKEGGLEVTPVTCSPKDSRPSVIHQATLPAKEAMPPPTSTVHQKRTLSASSATPRTPTKKPAPASFSFANGTTPPKVVQSKSIYSYSEKTVYGNPKDVLSPTMKGSAPRFVDCHSRYNGGDPVDLSVNSPQKPVIEIMRVPQSQGGSPYNRDSVTKNLYKANSQLVDGRRLGPNLEITLVGPNGKTYPNAHKTYPLPAQPHKRPASTYDYYVQSKSSRNDQHQLQHKPALPQHKATANTFAKPEASNKLPSAPSQPVNPIQNLPSLPYSPYLSQMYEQASKGLSPYLPLMDPAMYYTAAMQNFYSNAAAAAASSPMLSIPSPEQLKFYAELMAQSRLPFPFSLPPSDSSSSSNCSLKKQ